jgi:heme oxygenase (biliverdin-IX-beta and delta-forming)
MEKPRILVELKAQTRPQHDSVEQNLYGKSLMDGSMSLHQYRQFLEKFYGFHIPLEQAMERLPWDSVGINFDERRKIAFLKQDLHSLGLTDEDITRLPLAKDLPPIASMEAACGVMYVMEGSTLGGQIQARQVHKLFALTSENGAAYFSSYGANIGAMWKACCEAIVLVARDDIAQEARIIQSAKETFAALERWLNIAG